MSNPIRIIFDRQNQVIVGVTVTTIAGLPFTGAANWPKLYLGDGRDVIFLVVDPPTAGGQTLGGLAVYSQVNYAGAYTAVLAIGSNPVGNAAPTPYINDLNLTWDNTNGYFTGTIDLTLAATAMAMGPNPTLAACASFVIKQPGISPQTIWQSPANGILLYAPENPNAVTTNPSNPTAYFTAAETRSGFLPAPPVNGKILYCNSSDGAFTGVAYVSTDGTWHFEILATPLPSTPP